VSGPYRGFGVAVFPSQIALGPAHISCNPACLEEQAHGILLQLQRLILHHRTHHLLLLLLAEPLEPAHHLPARRRRCRRVDSRGLIGRSTRSGRYVLLVAIAARTAVHPLSD
jgi:hypothetical protein